MKEILPGVHHWVTAHPKIRIPVSSYYLAKEKVLLDPLVPPGGVDSLPGTPEHILLSNRHHYRGSAAFEARFGCTVWCVEEGLHEFPHEKVRSFRFGDVLAGSILSIEIDAICPDETAFHVPREGGIVAVADGVVRDGDGPLSFVPDDFLGDDPAGVKRGLRASYRRLLENEFDHLLLAHGNPWVGGAHEALRKFTGA